MGMVRTTTATAIVGVRCRNCYASSVVPVRSIGDFDPKYHRAACPACHGWNGDDTAPTIADNYDITGFKVIGHYPETSNSIDDFDHRDDLLSETMRRRVEAVEVDGRSCADVAREEGVSRGTVTSAVWRARKKLAGGDPYATPSTS